MALHGVAHARIVGCCLIETRLIENILRHGIALTGLDGLKVDVSCCAVSASGRRSELGRFAAEFSDAQLMARGYLED